MKPKTPRQSFIFGIAFGLAFHTFSPAAMAANLWDGGGSPDGNWGTITNWDDNLLPAFPVALTFAGTSQLATNNDQTGITVNGITFSSGAGAFTLAGNPITLAGNVTNSSAALQTINLGLVLNAARTFDAATGNITVGGAISGPFGFTKTGAGTLTVSVANSNTLANTITAGTLKLGAANTLTTTAGVTFGTSSTGTLDLAGFSQTTGNFTATTNTAGNAGTVTSSVAGGNLTINTGNTNGAPFSQTAFTNGTGSLALTLLGSNPGGNVQLLNTTNSFSGGLTIKSSNVGSLTTANLNTPGGFTGQTLQGVRSNSAAAVGSGSISLDNGQLFLIASLNVANSLNISARGGVLHMEGTGAATGGFNGTLTSAGGLLVVNSNSGNNNIVKLGNISGCTGTLGIDTTNIGGLAFNESSTGNSNLNLLWFGNSTNGGTGRVQYRGAGDATLLFGDLNNLNSNSVGSTMSGVIENAVASTTATFSIGNANVAPASFQGVIRNGTGTVALTKTGTNTQTLTGANTYTGATTINGGTLRVSGSLASGSAVAVNTGGILIANGTVGGTVAVAGGATLSGSGLIGGAVTLASGNAPGSRATLNLVDAVTSPLILNDAAGLTLGGSAGNSVSVNLEASGAGVCDKIELGANALNVGAGGAVITVTSLGVEAGQTYDLITYGSGTGSGFIIGGGSATVGGLTLANPSLGFGVSGTLNVTANAVQLVTTGAAPPSSAYWSGTKGSAWTSNSGGQGNFTTTAAGGTFTASLPGSSTDVFFANNSPSNLTNTLGGNFSLNSLTFRGSSAAANIGGANQLSLQGGGITLESGNGGATLGMTTLSLGATQTWTNGSANPLTVTAAVSGGVNGLTLAGNAVKLGGASFSSGALTVNAGLDIAGTSVTTGDLDGSGAVTNSGTNATITTTVTSDSVFSGSISDGGTGLEIALVKNGTASLTLGGASSYTGSTTINAGTVVIGNSGALGSTAGITTVANGSTLDLNGSSISETLNVTGGGVFGAGALINNDTVNPGSIDSEITNDAAITIGGAGDFTLRRIRFTSPRIVSMVGTGTVTLGDGTTSSHMNLLALSHTSTGTVNLGISSGNFIVCDRGLQVTGGGTVRYTGSSNNLLVDGCDVLLTHGTLDMNGHSDTAGHLVLGDGTNNGSVAGGATSTYTVSPSYNTFNTNTVVTPSTIDIRSGSIDVVLAASATVVLNKTTAGTVTLGQNNACLGKTVVSEGTLAFAYPCLADTADVEITTTIGSGGFINLVHGATDVVNALIVDGTTVANGTYGGAGSGATHIVSYLTGTGKIQVGSAANYDTWAAANGISGEPAGGDFDHDSISNLMEYALAGLNPTQSDASPGTLVGKLLTFNKRAEAVANGDVSYVIQQSNTLGAAPNPWVAASPVTEDSTSISWLLPSGSPKEFARLKITRN